jgi:hypothetical protein
VVAPNRPNHWPCFASIPTQRALGGIGLKIWTKYNTIGIDAMVKAQLLQDFNVEHSFWVDDKDAPQFSPHQKSYAEREVVTDFFKEYEDLLNAQRIRPQQECVGGKRNPEENVTDSETNENPRKKTFRRDTAKDG